MDFTIPEKKSVKIKIYGKDYHITKPTLKMVKHLDKKSRDANEDEKLDIMESYLCKVGIPKEVLDSMEMGHIEDLIKFVSGSTAKN